MRFGERLAPFKVPDEVLLSDALPRTSTGKVQKHVLRGLAPAAPAAGSAGPVAG